MRKRERKRETEWNTVSRAALESGRWPEREETREREGARETREFILRVKEKKKKSREELSEKRGENEEKTFVHKKQGEEK